MRLGISSYTYAWAIGVSGYPPPPRPMTASQLLGRADELDVRVVQIADNLPLDALSDRELDDLVREAGRRGIALEVGTRSIHPNHLRRYLAIAVRLKSPILRTVIDTPGHEPAPDEVVDLLRSVLPDFERAGVRLAIENHDRFRATVLAEILERLGGPIGICLDTANSIGCLENLETILAHLGQWIVNLHIKDYRIFRPAHQKGFVVEGCPTGQGHLDIAALLSAVRLTDRDLNAIVELWPPPEPTVLATIAKEEKWARESVRYLRQFISDYVP